MIFLWFYFLKSGLIFVETYYLCIFYIFYNKYKYFVTCKNYFLFFIGFIGFKNVDFLESHLTHVDFCYPILFSNATPFIILLSFCFLFTNKAVSILFLSHVLRFCFFIFFISHFYNLAIFFWKPIRNTLFLLSNLT